MSPISLNALINCIVALEAKISYEEKFLDELAADDPTRGHLEERLVTNYYVTRVELHNSYAIAATDITNIPTYEDLVANFQKY